MQVLDMHFPTSASGSFWRLQAPTRNGGIGESRDWGGGERDSMHFGLILFFLTRGDLPPLEDMRPILPGCVCPGGQKIPHPENERAPHKSIAGSAETIIKPASNRLLAIAEAGQR